MMGERFDPRTLSVPIVQAPMAGGPSTPALAIAACQTGALGFLAAGYKRAQAVSEEIATVRAAAGAPFGVNLFVPSATPADPDRIRPYLEELTPEAERQGAELGEPRFDDDGWAAKVELMAQERVPIVSFTFGCPSAEVVERMHDSGSAVWVTVTKREEAHEAARVGADALVVQGTEAGGHRGAFVDDEDAAGSGLIALLRVIASELPLPLIASGGIGDGAALAAVLCAGAVLGQIGTALMLAPEAGTSPAQRELLTQPIPTRLTRAFSGRSARGMVNRFLLDHSATAPIAYPEIHHVTSPLRAAARKRGDADAFNLWAGQAHQLADARPAAEIISRMHAEAREAVRDAASRLELTTA
jgi:nitronate monooxygenase